MSTRRAAGGVRNRGWAMRPAVALTRATLQSYRNALRRAFRANPVPVTAVLLVVAITVLLIGVFQLQAVLPFLSGSTLQQLTADQVDGVGRASLTGLAAVSWGVAMVLEAIGFQSGGLSAVAASHGVRAWHRTVGQAAPVIMIAGIAAILLIGPASFAGLYRSLLLGGHLARSGAAALAAVITVCVILSAALTALLIPTLAALAVRRDPRSPEVKGLAAAVSGGLLITGITMVLATRTSGLFVLSPPLLVTGGVPRSAAGALLIVVTVLVTAVLAVAVMSVHGVVTVRAGGANLRLSWLRLGNTVATVEVRQAIRDATFLSSSAISIAGSLATGLLYRFGDLTLASASLVLYGLIGLSSIAPCVAAFRAATTGWLYVVRPGAYLYWYRNAAVGQLVAVLLVTVCCRVVTTLPPAPSTDLVLLCLSACGAIVGLVSGVAVNQPGVSKESRFGLFSGGIIAAVVLLAIILPTMNFTVFDDALVTMGYLLAAGLVTAVVGDIMVRRRMRESAGSHAVP